jgi:hypothetical protein
MKQRVAVLDLSGDISGEENVRVDAILFCA